MTDLLIRNIRPMAGATADLLIRAGRIAAVGPNLVAEGVAVEDGQGAIAIPALVDAHTHLDKTTWGMGWYAGRKGGDLQALIDNERNERIPLGLDVHRQSMRHAMQLIANGTGHIRSHVDVDHDHKLTLLEGKLRTRDALQGAVDIQIVAFPQSGLMIRPGVYDLLDEALAMGADVVGGLDPSSMDRDPKASLDAIFRLAEKHGKPIDIHLHEYGELGAFTLEEIITRTRAHGMQGKVGVSHCFCLGMPNPHRVGPADGRCGARRHPHLYHGPSVSRGAKPARHARRWHQGRHGLRRYPRHLGPMGPARHAAPRPYRRHEKPHAPR